MPELTAPVPINAQHDPSVFDCGKPPLNEFLRRHALDKQNAKLSRTYVAERGFRIAAYYTLVHVSVAQEEAPKKFGRGMPSEIPAMLMAKLAVDKAAQEQGLGRSLLVDALTRTWAVMENGPVPVRLFIVDAKDDDARSFYARFDMIPSPLDPMRLFLSYKTIAAILSQIS